MTKIMREAKLIAERLGVADVTVEKVRRATHPTLRGRYRGQAVRCTVPLTPSDDRAMKNFKADVRRACRSIEDSR